MITFRVDVDYPNSPWYERFEVVEYACEQQQQALITWMVDERARLLPGRKLIEQKSTRRFLITVQPKAPTLVSWISNNPDLPE